MSTPLIHAYTFDAAMTLFRVYPSVGTVYADAARPFGIQADPQQMDEAFTKAWAAHQPATPHTSEAEERAWWHGIVSNTFDIAGALLALEGDFDALFDALFARFEEQDAWRVYDDVFPTLAALKRSGKRLAVVSNFDSRLHTVLDALALTQFFDTVVISAAVGVRKPDPAIFLHACRELGVSPAETCHIGDSLTEDYRGALAAGMQARLLTRGGEGVEGVPCIDSLSRL